MGTLTLASVAQLGSAQTFTQPQAISAPASTTPGLQVNVPDLTDNSLYGLRLVDGAGNAGALLHIDHNGAATGTGGGASIGLDVMSRNGSTGLGIAGHNYTNQNFAQLDNTGSGVLLTLGNTENVNNNPSANGFGTGHYIQFTGYDGTTSYSDGVVTGGNTVTSATAAFLSNEAGKAITVGGIATTIATVVSATQITTASSSLTNASGVTFSFPRKANVATLGVLNPSLQFQANPANSSTGFSFSTSNTNITPLTVTQRSSSTKDALAVSGNGSGAAIKVTNAGGSGAGVAITQSVAANGLSLLQNGTATAAAITQNAAGIGLLVDSSTNIGANAVVTIKNKGTGVSLDVQGSAATVFQIDAAGNHVSNTTNGIKIATATTQKLGFYNAAPVVQPSGTPAASTDLASVISLANSLRTNLLALGLVA